MNFFKKVFNFLYGFILFVTYTKSMDLHSLLKGMRVAIVGAADSAYNTGKGEWIDAFDYIIRINKAPYMLKQGHWKNDIGTKTDILFHSFFENKKSGGGPLDITLYDALGIRYIINPIAEYNGYRVSFNFYKKYLLKRITYRLPQKLYHKIQDPILPFKPTIGYCALMSVLETEFSELYITGFTFFKTAFGEGYRNDMKEASQVQKYLSEAGLHNADLEFREFKRVLKGNVHKNIVIDSGLSAILRDEL